MLLVPRKFGEGMFDDFMDYPLERALSIFNNPAFSKKSAHPMKTDVKEKDGIYEISMDLPGFKKEDVKIELDNGYMTVAACNSSDNEEGDQESGYIRRERYRGECKRSFYVGEYLNREDIKAKFEDGILFINFPKEQPKKIESKYIDIE